VIALNYCLDELDPHNHLTKSPPSSKTQSIATNNNDHEPPPIRYETIVYRITKKVLKLTYLQ